MTFDDYIQFDGTGLAALIADGQVSAQEVFDAARNRVAHVNPEINAVVLDLFDDAAAAGIDPRGGPFAGVPFLLKDLGQYMAGVPTSAGSRLFADSIQREDSSLVKRYRAAGLRLCGKTNTPELGLATTTEPLLFGATRNPLQPTHSAGGSSGGAAAAVASGMVPMAHASDGGGSIRIPASCCGLIGLKPTRGRVPLGPHAMEGWGGLSTTHAITRSVRDSAALLDISSGEETGAPYFAPPRPRSFRAQAARDPGSLRMVLHLQAFNAAPVDTEIARLTEQAAAACATLGHEVTLSADQPLRLAADEVAEAHGIVALAHVADSINQRLRELGRGLRDGDLEAVTLRNHAAGNAMSAAQYAWAMTRMRALGLALALLCRRH